MAKSYKHFSPVKQNFKMSCWAASLEWWTRFMSPAKSIQFQSSLIYDARDKGYSPNVEPLDDNYGGMEIQHIETVLKSAEFGMTTARMKCFEMTPEFINEKLAKGPVFISYYEPKVGGGHANIIINCKTKWDGSATMRVMEPDIPKYEKRHISYYYNDGDMILGWLN